MILDPSGRGPTARQLTLAGLGMITAVALVLYLLGLRYTGRFEAQTTVTAVLTSTGDGLPARADVKFRGMVVGRVEDVAVTARGARQQAVLALQPILAQSIPANVAARVVPANIFGVTAIELVDTAPTAATLRAGATIPEDTSAATVQLQTALDVLRTVLNNIQPEKLGRVLSTLAAALDPAARVPGSTVERLDRWITEVRETDGIGDLLGNLGRAASALSVSAPDLVGMLSKSVTTARTLTEQRTALVQLLTTGGHAVDTVNGLFAANPDSGKFLVSGLNGLFASLAQDPQAIPYAIATLNTALQRLQTAFTFGPKKQMVWKMDVSFTPFQQYTAKDCPHYGAMAGPRCGGPTVPETAPPQDYPPQLVPGRVAAAGPPPVAPAVPSMPAAPSPFAIPGFPMLPSIPGLTAPVPPAGAAPAANPPGLPGGPAAAPDGAAAPQPSPGGPVSPDSPAPPGNSYPSTAPDGPAAGTSGAGAAVDPAVASVQPAGLRGADAVAALVGGAPNMAQVLLLSSVLAGGYLVPAGGAGAS
ncbi:MlaD family protein [Nocardia sp. alder85J]|uniref:MlaD family protein n=1 Tax=Nocardia sp. alder85J TaxID=2862949 RepID=UPI001CD6ABD2|nr:MCE family protein [Nocardia sp. alder85J]MCX4098221.1 MCE family protein [Nocardia sp. alder85J]